jgi:hypothetical protein
MMVQRVQLDKRQMALARNSEKSARCIASFPFDTYSTRTVSPHRTRFELYSKTSHGREAHPSSRIHVPKRDQGAKPKRTPRVDKLVYSYPIVLYPNNRVEAHVNTSIVGAK